MYTKKLNMYLVLFEWNLELVFSWDFWPI